MVTRLRKPNAFSCHCCALPLSCSEGLTEVTAPEASLEKPEHIRVLPGRRKWSTEEQWPKLEMVLATKFWSDDLYRPIREMLRHPVANPEVILGGEFITVDTTARKVQAVQPPPQPRAFPESAPPHSHRPGDGGD